MGKRYTDMDANERTAHLLEIRRAVCGVLHPDDEVFLILRSDTKLITTSNIPKDECTSLLKQVLALATVRGL